MSEQTLIELAATYLRLREEKFKRQGELKFINEELEKTNVALNAIFQRDEMSGIDFRDRYLYQSVEDYPKIIPGKDHDYFAWLDAHGEGGIAKRSIHNKTHPSWYRKNIRGDKKAPPMHPEWEEELTQFLDVFQKIRVNVRGENQSEQKAAAYKAYSGKEFSGKWSDFDE